MNNLRMYYWKERVHNGLAIWMRKFMLGRDPSVYFKTGNVGDLFNEDIARFAYGCRSENCSTDLVPRAFFVGSTLHQARGNCLISGVGVKHQAADYSFLSNSLIVGLRGELSAKTLKNQGIDLSKVSFLGDPGLLAKKFYSGEEFLPRPDKGRVGWIPHFRQRFRSFDNRLYFISVDTRPDIFFKELIRCEHIVTSSLHGLIFADSFGIPVSLILPDFGEPHFKYWDYLSIFPERSIQILDSFQSLNMGNLKNSPYDVSSAVLSMKLPSLEELQRHGCVYE